MWMLACMYVYVYAFLPYSYAYDLHVYAYVHAYVHVYVRTYVRMHASTSISVLFAVYLHRYSFSRISSNIHLCTYKQTYPVKAMSPALTPKEGKLPIALPWHPKRRS